MDIYVSGTYPYHFTVFLNQKFHKTALLSTHFGKLKFGLYHFKE